MATSFSFSISMQARVSDLSVRLSSFSSSCRFHVITCNTHNGVTFFDTMINQTTLAFESVNDLNHKSLAYRVVLIVLKLHRCFLVAELNRLQQQDSVFRNRLPFSIMERLISHSVKDIPSLLAWQSLVQYVTFH